VVPWFTLCVGEVPGSRNFYSDTPETTVVDLGYICYLDLKQNPVGGNLTLEPFGAQVCVSASRTKMSPATCHLAHMVHFFHLQPMGAPLVADPAPAQ
jgi:hypothetical protein